MKFNSNLANKYYQSFKRTGNPYFYIIAVDTEKTEALRQQILLNNEQELGL